MEKEKINVAEILKNCQSGMNLDCVCFENVVFDRVDDKNRIRCLVGSQRDEVSFNEYGCLNGSPSAKCVIFPKGEITWDNLSLKFSYEDGDILYCKGMYDWVFIYKHTNDCFLSKYVAISGDGNFYANPDRPLLRTLQFTELRLATKDERQKLLDVIKANGFKWNPETKTSEKLIVPKFKIGDRIKSVITSSYFNIVDIKDDVYFIKSDGEKYPYRVPFLNEINYELVPNKFDITTLKPFESRVLVRNRKIDKWRPATFGYYTDESNYYVLGGSWWIYCIPYEGNEHLMGKKDDCDGFYKVWEV